jgi:glycosyltransferase involved in cell wall biosynthesis
MRIVYVVTTLEMGGAERQAITLANRIAERGHTVAVLVLKPHAQEEWPAALQVLHLDMNRTAASVLAGLARGRGFLREFRPDLVHSHTFHANLIARLLRLIAPVPIVFSTVHNVYEGSWTRMLAYRLTDGLSLRTVAVSEAATLRFMRLKAVPKRKCFVISNGIDTNEFVPSSGRRARMRDLMGAGQMFIWLAAGRIVPAKDYPNLLRAFARVWALRRDAQLWVAGAGEDAEFAKASALATELGLGDAVRWLGLCRDMPALFDAADAFVLSSAWEGMPLVVGEAMAMEKPVVATDVGGVRELVADAGALAPLKNPADLAIAMLGIMQMSQEDRAAMGRAARVRIEGEFNMDAKADEWEALYRTALENRKKPA